MKIIRIDKARDGGTICFEYEDGHELYIDNRIGSRTTSQFYDDYPEHKNAKIVRMTNEDIHNLICCMMEYYHKLKSD